MDAAQNHAFVAKSVAAGDVADFTSREGYDDAAKPPVEAAFIRALMLGLATDGDGNKLEVRMPGVRIRGATVRGPLNLVDCSGAGGNGLPALALEQCDLPERIDVSHARLSRLSISESRFAALVGTGARIDGDFDFVRSIGYPATGAIDVTETIVWFPATRIGGDVSADGARLSSSERVALNLLDAHVFGSVNLQQCRIVGEALLRGARIGGTFHCGQATFEVAKGAALQMESTTIGGDAFINNVKSKGSVKFTGAQIGGDVVLDATRVEGIANGEALSGARAVVAGSVFIDEEFVAVGEVTFSSAKVAGSLVFRQSSFSCKGMEANALSANGVEVGGALLMVGIKAEGCAFFLGARITGDIECRQSTFICEDGIALTLNSARIEGRLFVDKNTFKGGVSLEGAQVGRMFDEPDAGWAGADAIDLDELSYTHLSTVSPGRRQLWKTRARWLRRNTGKELGKRRAFSNQPWRECAAAFARAGLYQDARRIARAEQCEANKNRDWWKRPIVLLFAEVPFGYGLSVTRAAITSALFWALGWAGVEAMLARGTLVDAVATRPATCTSIAAPLYALDVAIPVLDLKQESECEPGKAPQAKNLGAGLELALPFDGGRWRFFEEIAIWRWAKALYALFGAAVVGFAILTFSGVFRPKA